jgi:hypothetical protein
MRKRVLLPEKDAYFLHLFPSDSAPIFGLRATYHRASALHLGPEEIHRLKKPQLTHLGR